MRIMVLAIIGALAACFANPALAAKHHGPAAASHKAQPDPILNTNPYAPGQQRYRAVPQKKK